jgi:hypothetical protein
VDHLDLDVAHPRQRVGHPFLHGGGDLRQHLAVRHHEPQIGAGARAFELDAQPPAPLAQARAVHRRDGSAHDLAQRGLAHTHRASGLLDEDPAQVPASAGSRAPASARKDVE